MSYLLNFPERRKSSIQIAAPADKALARRNPAFPRVMAAV
jgi:hypothetical protein